MSGTLFIINPNSSQSVTDGIDRAVEPLRLADGPVLKCVTLREGPPAIQTQRDVDGVVGPLCREVERLDGEAAGFVIACFSDPGLHSVREVTRKPVLGIAECGVLTALTLGQRFGVISILETSIPRHLRYFGAMGVMERLAGDLAIGLGVLELADEERTVARMREVGRRLKSDHGAHVLVMGCAGMARFRQPLEEAVGIPVVEPTQAAAAMALGRVRLGWTAKP